MCLSSVFHFNSKLFIIRTTRLNYEFRSSLRENSSSTSVLPWGPVSSCVLALNNSNSLHWFRLSPQKNTNNIYTTTTNKTIFIFIYRNNHNHHNNGLNWSQCSEVPSFFNPFFLTHIWIAQIKGSLWSFLLVVPALFIWCTHTCTHMWTWAMRHALLPTASHCSSDLQVEVMLQCANKGGEEEEDCKHGWKQYRI